MYKFERYRQLGLADFNQPVGLKMNPENRWGKRQTMRLTLKYTPLVYERRGFLHSSGRLSDHGIKSL